MMKVVFEISKLLLILLVLTDLSEGKRGGGRPHSTKFKGRKTFRTAIPNALTALKSIIKANPEKSCSVDFVAANLDFTSTHADSSGGVINTEKGWCAESDAVTTDSVTIDLDTPTQVEGVTTQGFSNVISYVSSYKVQYSNDTVTAFITVVDSDGNDLVFNGNYDNTTPVSNDFPEPIIAQFIRIIPVDHFSRKCMRVGLYDCKDIIDGIDIEVPSSWMQK